jgi:protein tyrosine/serine phosphatase
VVERVYFANKGTEAARTRNRTRIRTGLIVAGLVIAGAIGLTEFRRAQSHADEKQTLAGVANFGRLNARLYRGAQPSDEGFAALKRLGVDTIVSFTLSTDANAAEALRVRALGMDYVSLPWSVLREPSPEQVTAFLALFRDHPDRTVFLHCWQGADRTGVMVALYRIARDHWSPALAIDEMQAFHYHFILHPHLQRFVESFAVEVRTTPSNSP